MLTVVFINEGKVGARNKARDRGKHVGYEASHVENCSERWGTVEDGQLETESRGDVADLTARRSWKNDQQRCTSRTAADTATSLSPLSRRASMMVKRRTWQPITSEMHILTARGEAVSGFSGLRASRPSSMGRTSSVHHPFDHRQPAPTEKA